MCNSFTKEAWVSIYFNELYYFIHTMSRYNLLVFDYQMPIYHLSKDIDIQELGRTVMLALNDSRIIDVNTPEENFSRDGALSAYKKWINDGKMLCNSKSRKDFLTKMMLCHICQEGNHIIISPTLHKKIDLWTGDGFSEKDSITLLDTVSYFELGKSIIEVISRCKTNIAY